MKQQFNGPVQYVAKRDVVVVQQVVPSCLTPDELALVMAYRAERATRQCECNREGRESCR